MEYQIPLAPLTSCFTDVTNPDNELLGFFAQVDPGAVEAICTPYYSGRGPDGYGSARYLALLLRVKQNIVSDRRLVADLRGNELWRRAIGLGADPARCRAARPCRPSARGSGREDSGRSSATSSCP